MKRAIFLFAAPVALGFCVGAASAQTLKTVKDRGALICGVSQGLPGFSNPDDKGNWTGFDVDFCRALAAAVFNDATKVKFTPLSAKDRFEPLKTGDIDVLSRNTTWTLSRDVAYGNFAGVTYYDGQGFLVRKSLKVNSALELNGASVCTQTGTTSELNLSDFFRTHKIKYELVAFATADEVVKAYDTGRCDVFSTDLSQPHDLGRSIHRRFAELGGVGSDSPPAAHDLVQSGGVHRSALAVSFGWSCYR